MMPLGSTRLRNPYSCGVTRSSASSVDNTDRHAFVNDGSPSAIVPLDHSHEPPATASPIHPVVNQFGRSSRSGRSYPHRYPQCRNGILRARPWLRQRSIHNLGITSHVTLTNRARTLKSSCEPDVRRSRRASPGLVLSVWIINGSPASGLTLRMPPRTVNGLPARCSERHSFLPSGAARRVSAGLPHEEN